jgi:hypothetical protein
LPGDSTPIGQAKTSKANVLPRLTPFAFASGGGNWRLGRTWPKEWNQMIMKALRDAELRTGETLTRNEILDLVAVEMRRYNFPMNFTPWGVR